MREWALELMNESKQEKEETVSDNYLSVGEVIDKLRVNASTLWRWDKTGYLKKLKVGGKWKSHATLTLLAKQECPLWLQYD